MCAGRPGRVVRIAGDVAHVCVSGRVLPVSLVVLDEPAAPGDWLLIHSGLAVAHLHDDDVHLLRQLEGEPQ